jgi:hypothetical protein
MRFFLFLVLSTLIGNIALCSVEQGNDFEKSSVWRRRNIPAGWSAGIHHNKLGIITLDDKNVHSGGKSLKLQSSEKKSRIVVTSPIIAVPSGKSDIYISIWSHYESQGEGKVVLIGYGKAGKQCQWKTVFFLRGKSDWRQFVRKMPLKPETVKIRISLRLNGIGSVWYDDLKFSFDKIIKKQTRKDFNAITDLSKWSDYVPDGAENTFEVKKDNKEYVELVWKDGLTNFGICSKAVPVQQFQNYAFSVNGKTTGDGTLQLIARASNSNGAVLMEEKSVEFISKDKWRRLERKFNIPISAVSLQLFCMNRGAGSVWLKNAELKKISPAEVRSSFPVSFGCEPASGNANWNNGRAVFNTFTDSPCSLSFDFWGDKSRLQSPSFVIELPEAVAVEQCFNSHASVEPAVVTPKVRRITDKGIKWIQYTYSNPWALKNIKPAPGFCRALTFLFKPGNAMEINKNYPARAYLINDGKRSECKNFYINFLAGMKKTLNPRHYRVFIWSSWDTAVTGNKLFEKVLKKFEEAGMNFRANNGWGRSDCFKLDRICEQRNWRCVTAMGGNVFHHAFTEKFGEQAKAVTWKGKRYAHICPSVILSGEGQEVLAKAIKCAGETGRVKKGSWVLFDYEPWQSQDWCYCKKCLKRFAEFSGKSASAKEIRKKLWRDWSAFRVSDTDAILKNATGTVRRLFPGVKVADYDYPVDFREKDLSRRFWRIPKDTRKSDKYLDAHYLSYYYYHGKRGFELLDINAKVLKKPFVMFSLLARYSDPRQSTYARSINETLTPVQFRQAMLNGASAGAVGHAIFPGVKIDGKYFIAIDKTMTEIAALEDFYQQGQRQDSAAKISASWQSKSVKDNIADKLAYRIHVLKDKLAVSIFNFSKLHTMKCKVEIPKKGGKWQVLDVVENKKIDSPSGKNYWTASELKNGVSVKILASGVALLKVIPAI